MGKVVDTNLGAKGEGLFKAGEIGAHHSEAFFKVGGIEAHHGEALFKAGGIGVHHGKGACPLPEVSRGESDGERKG